MNDKKEAILEMKLAELQFRLAVTVRLATLLGRQPLDVPTQWSHGKHIVTYEEIVLTKKQSDIAADYLKRTATYLMSITIKDSLKKIYKDPKSHKDKNVVAAYQISRLIRNAFAHYLIILPNEFYGRRKLNLFNKDLSTFTELKSIIASSDFVFNPTKWNRRSKSYIADKKTLKVLLKKIRNGIAHQRIESINEDRKWTGVIIQDINERNSDNVELSIKFQIKEEFKTFAIFISSKYIEEIERLGKKKSKRLQ